MMTVKKSVLAVVGALLVAVVVYTAWQYVRAVPYMEEMSKAEQFGKTRSKEECLLDIALRVAACDDQDCRTLVSVGGYVCLEVASGEREDYCDINNSGIPKRSVIDEICEKAQRSEYCETSVYTAVFYYCSE